MSPSVPWRAARLGLRPLPHARLSHNSIQFSDRVTIIRSAALARTRAEGAAYLIITVEPGYKRSPACAISVVT